LHIFFDLDGTLTDPKIGVTKSVAFALSRLGHSVPDLDDLTWVIGPALIDSFERLGVDDPEQALELYRERYRDVGLFENSVYPGIPKALTAVTKAGFSASVATAKPHIYARRITAHFDLSRFFAHEFGPELDGTRNDKGELLAFALETTGIKASDSIMVGDRIHDINAARAVGMKCVGVTWGYGGAEETDLADFQCASPENLPLVIGQAFAT